MPNYKTSYADQEAFITKDGSTVRELMHPSGQACTHQSLAEARVEPGCATRAHRHRASEEIYHFLGGQGRMRMGTVEFAVKAGDTVCIAPGTVHSLTNTGPDVLSLLCLCAPAYTHADTELLED